MNVRHGTKGGNGSPMSRRPSYGSARKFEKGSLWAVWIFARYWAGASRAMSDLMVEETDGQEKG
jgi:hypothetical protein